MDIYPKKKRSEIMSRIKGKETNLEKMGGLLLKEISFRFVQNPKGIFGNPDAANKSRKIAVFFDSEFWHGHQWKIAKRKIKSNKKFWIQKIENNIKRDRLVNRTLKKQGWKVIRIWSKDLRPTRKEKTLRKVKKILDLE